MGEVREESYYLLSLFSSLSSAIAIHIAVSNLPSKWVMVEIMKCALDWLRLDSGIYISLRLF